MKVKIIVILINNLIRIYMLLNLSLILDCIPIIIIFIYSIILLRILTNDTSHITNPSTLATWTTVSHYFCIIMTIIIVGKFAMIGVSHEIIPLIVLYILFIFSYVCSMYKIASYIAW